MKSVLWVLDLFLDQYPQKSMLPILEQLKQRIVALALQYKEIKAGTKGNEEAEEEQKPLPARKRVAKTVGHNAQNLPADLLLIQTFLNEKGFSCELTGEFDAATEEALRNAYMGLLKEKAPKKITIALKSPLMLALLMPVLPPLGKPKEIASTEGRALFTGKEAAQMPAGIFITIPENASAATPVLVLLAGAGQCNSSWIMRRVPSSWYAKAVIIAANHPDKWENIAKVYEAKMAEPLSKGKTAICGFSAGGRTLLSWGCSGFKKVGLIDPDISLESVNNTAGNTILSIRPEIWPALMEKIEIDGKKVTKAQPMLAIARSKCKTVEVTEVPHFDYVKYFFGQFSSFI